MILICSNPNCNKEFERKRNRVYQRNYCCNRCRTEMLSKYNREENPINKKEYWTEEQRKKQRESVMATCKDERIAYRKFHQRHLHRVIAEKMLGRPLKKGEVVHHINFDKLDNRPENLEVMTQSEHAKLHNTKKKGGDVND